MAPPPHPRQRTRSGGMITDLIHTLEDESKEKGREYFVEEMEWDQPKQYQKKVHRHDGDKKHHGVAEKITKIYNAVEDSSKQKGREYFEEENTWPVK